MAEGVDGGVIFSRRDAEAQRRASVGRGELGVRE